MEKPPTTSEPPARAQVTLIADNPEFVWTDEAGTANPTLDVPAGAEVTVTVKNDPEQAGFHSLQVGDQGASADISNAGDEVTYTFTAPETGSLDYVCPYHSSTMRGTVRVAR